MPTTTTGTNASPAHIRSPGDRSRLMDATMLALNRSQVVIAQEDYLRFYTEMDKACVEIGVPEGQHKGVLKRLKFEVAPRDIMGVTPQAEVREETQAAMIVAPPADLDEFDFGFDTVGLGTTSTDGVPTRPLYDQVNEAVKARGLYSTERVQFFSQHIVLNGQECALIPTWHLENEQFVWNLCGRINKAGESEKNISDCDEDILLFENGRALCISQDFIWEAYKIPDNFGSKGLAPSKFSGTTHRVHGTWFIWVVKKAPLHQPTFLRCWLNEKVRNPSSTSDLVRTRKSDLRFIQA